MAIGPKVNGFVAAMASPATLRNAILTIECLVEDFGWDAVMGVLMKEAASDERLNKVEELLDAANEGKGQLFVL